MVVDLPLVHRGKVRDVHDAGDGRLLLVASDRLSAFDVVMAEAVPDKGRVLTGLSVFWFEHLRAVAANHVISTDVADFPDGAKDPSLAGRTMLVSKAEMLPIECIVRGYLAGSGWREYHDRGTVHGAAMPSGLRLADRLPEPIFTPSTKAADGLHDENIDLARAAELVGDDLLEQAKDLSLRLYTAAANHAAERGILLADTKFELGIVDGTLVVADEMLTPDSSRFWPADDWQPGTTPPSFDKQPVRDHLDGLDWDKTPPPPPLGPEVIAATRARYIDAYERLTDRSFDEWLGATDPSTPATESPTT